jgi:hypothetical protein
MVNNHGGAAGPGRADPHTVSGHPRADSALYEPLRLAATRAAARGFGIVGGSVSYIDLVERLTMLNNYP